jgi:hypothetical protein
MIFLMKAIGDATLEICPACFARLADVTERDSRPCGRRVGTVAASPPRSHAGWPRRAAGTPAAPVVVEDTAGGRPEPVWSPDGEWLFDRSGDLLWTLHMADDRVLELDDLPANRLFGVVDVGS